MVQANPHLTAVGSEKVADRQHQVKEGSCGQAEHVDPRVRRTRRLLQDSFRELIHERSFSEISIQEIAERAEVNRATFYAHYADKQDLAVTVLRADLRMAVLGRFEEPPAFTQANLTLFCHDVFEFLGGFFTGCMASFEDLQSVLAGTLQDELYAMILGWLGHAKVMPRLFPDSSREVVASMMAGGIFSTATRWIRSGRAQPVGEVARQAVAVVLGNASPDSF